MKKIILSFIFIIAYSYGDICPLEQNELFHINNDPLKNNDYYADYTAPQPTAYYDEECCKANFPLTINLKDKKKWTILIYIAADNNLYPFAYRNLAQMKQIGSNENLNILVHLDIKHPDQPKVTRHLYIEQNKIWQIGEDARLDSGSDVTLFNATKWALNDFPSEHFALVLWNHGSGPLNPVLKGGINPAQLFKYNPDTKLIELNRSIHFIDFLELNNQNAEPRNNPYITHKNNLRGVCFDDTNGSYLDDIKLIRAFNKIIKENEDKKIDLIIFDACLMAGIEIADIMEPFVRYMVGSQEVVLGTGYDYHDVLQALAYQKSITPEAFARHIVNSYYKTYGSQTNDYTNSAINLEQIHGLLNNLNELSTLLVEALKKQTRDSVRQVLKKSRSQHYCISFDQPSYIDLDNFYRNLLKNIDQIKLSSTQETNFFIIKLKQLLQEGISLIYNIVMAHVEGKNLTGAGGISIHFPEYYINSPTYQSYYATEFAQKNAWATLLKEYLK